MSKRPGPRQRVNRQTDRPNIASPRPPQNKMRRIAAAAFASITAGTILLAIFFAVFHRDLAAEQPDSKTDNPQIQEIDQFIRGYFSTWSNQDLKGYSKCFLKNACVQFIDPAGQIRQDSLSSFLASQADVFRTGQRHTEVPESIDIRLEANLARVVVYWKLTAGERKVYGYDHFTLMKVNGKWGIVNLVFYETKGPEKR